MRNLPGPYIQRTLEKRINSCLKLPEIIAIVGTRQCGKTTLLHHIINKLPSQDVTVIDFEDRDEVNLFSNDIKSFAKLHVAGKKYLFIDEFQYAINGGKQLKYIYDTYPVKIFITGSSSTELSVQSIQHLVGRIFVFTLHPFSFKEFLNYKHPGLSSFLSDPTPLQEEIIKRISGYFQEYITFGGYPRVALSQTNEEKQLVLKNIFNTYLLKEIRQILNYTNDTKLEKLIQALSLQTGSTCNYNELATLTGFKQKKLHEALDILTQTFIISPCRPFYTNKRLELVKAPKFYFTDNGFRNMACRNFSQISLRSDKGALRENFLAQELRRAEVPLRYWRTKSKAEVDFIIEKNGEAIPLEVKSTLVKPACTKSFRSFLAKYTPSHGIIASEHLMTELPVAGIPIYFRPFWLATSEI